MKEQLISHKTAILANKKGLKLREFSGFGIIIDRSNIGSNLDEDYGWICTQTTLQKLLREEYDIHISIDILYCNYINQKKLILKVKALNVNNSYQTRKKDSFDVYEEAMEVGLQKALKLINNGSN